MNGQEKSAYINYRISRAESTYVAAQDLAKGKHWNSCINRLYYSRFYAVSALLMEENIIPKSHSGVKIQFFQNFIKAGKIELRFGELYSDLFDWRQKGDYNDFF